jgi:hypothetical protein
LNVAKIFENCNQEVPFLLCFPDSVATHRILNIAKKIQKSVEKNPITLLCRGSLGRITPKKGGKNGERDN